MGQDPFLEITPDLRLPLAELEYQASRSGGPGGQHVNTSSTRIEVWWDVAGSPSLNPEQRGQLLERLRPRLDSTGRLRMVSSGTRSQLRNREDATERLRSVVAAARVTLRIGPAEATRLVIRASLVKAAGKPPLALQIVEPAQPPAADPADIRR